MKRWMMYGASIVVSTMIGISVFSSMAPHDGARSVMKSGAGAVNSRPYYQIYADYDKKKEEIRGHIRITLAGACAGSEKEVYFQLYPNAFKKWTYNKESKPTSPGYLNVSSIKVDDIAVKEKIQGTVMRVDLSKSLKNGVPPRIEMDYVLHLPHGGTRLNQFKDTAFLAQWYPMLIVKDKEGWHKDPYTTVGDPFYTQVSDFEVTFRVPKGYNVISTGCDSKKLLNKAAGKVTLKQNNVRDFAAVLTRDYKVIRGNAENVQVNLWYLRGMEKVSPALHAAAVSGMNYYSKHFGKYPYPEIDVVLGETGYGIAGMEYPGLVTSVDQVPSFRGMVPAVNVVVHELAHQWWYGVVGNNQVKEPWLDEGLTTFSEFLYMQDKMNQNDRDFLKRATRKTDEIHRKTGLTSGETLYKYPDDVYGLMVYIRPAAMMYDLVEKIGKEKVLHIMNAYYDQYQFRVATSKDFFAIASKIAGQDLTPFFQKWLYFK